MGNPSLPSRPLALSIAGPAVEPFAIVTACNALTEVVAFRKDDPTKAVGYDRVLGAVGEVDVAGVISRGLLLN